MADLPPFIAIASTDQTVELFEPASSLDEAFRWCEEQLPELAGEVEQLAIFRTHIVHLLRFGEVPKLAAVCGWQWVDDAWHEVATHTLQLVFSRFYPRRQSMPTDSQHQEAFQHCATHVANVTIAVSGLAQGLQQFRRLLITERDRLRVLVVNDNPHARVARRRSLQFEHDVFDANGYSEALVSLATGVFDAVVVDEELGAIGSGSALLKEVRNRWPHVRRVLCSKRDFDSTDYLEPGVAHRVLVMPIDSIQLLSSLR